MRKCSIPKVESTNNKPLFQDLSRYYANNRIIITATKGCIGMSNYSSSIPMLGLTEGVIWRVGGVVNSSIDCGIVMDRRNCKAECRLREPHLHDLM